MRVSESGPKSGHISTSTDRHGHRTKLCSHVSSFALDLAPGYSRKIERDAHASTHRSAVARARKREKYEKGFQAIDFDTAYIVGDDDEQLRNIKTPTNPYATGELAKLQCRGPGTSSLA